MEALKVKGLKKRFGKKTVLKGLSFSVVQGEVFGFIGPNGAGKTTTIKSVLGFVFPDEGEIEILGEKNLSVRVKARLGFLPERTYVPLSITGKEYFDFCADAFGIPYYARKRKYIKLFELVDLIGFEEKKLSSYSKGMLQRLLFASTLINEPELLILDEPMSGLDPVGRSIIASVIKDLKERGRSVFYSSHIIQDVERLSDRVAILVDGEVKLIDYVANLVTQFLSGYSVFFKKPGRSSLLQERVGKDNLWQTLNSLREKGYEIVSVEPERRSLEDILVSFVKGES